MRDRVNFDQVLIFSHSQEGTVGVDDELLEYIRYKVENCYLFKFPFIYSSDGAIRVTLSTNGVYKKHKSFFRFYNPALFSYLKDVMYAFVYCAKYIKKNSLVVCTDNILVIATYLPIFFQRLLGGKTSNVYYLIDYTPRRFAAPAVNWFYEFVDKLSFQCSSWVWVLNKKMVSGRISDKGYPSRTDNVVVVPHGNNSHKYNDLDYNKFDLHNIAYLGGVYSNKGAELFAQIITELVNAGYKDIVLHVIGGGDLDYLNKQIKTFSHEKNVTLYGRVADQDNVEKILLSCSLAIAPYNPHDSNNFSFYADPGKVKVYLGCGLPVVITKVPDIHKTVQNHHAGLTAEYDAKDFKEKIIMIINNIDFYRQNARKLGMRYSWNNLFNAAFNAMKKNDE